MTHDELRAISAGIANKAESLEVDAIVVVVFKDGAAHAACSTNLDGGTRAVFAEAARLLQERQHINRPDHLTPRGT